MPRPIPTRIFHITAISNLVGVCAAGALRSKNVLQMNDVGVTSIAHQTIQVSRAAKRVTTGLGGTLHDYVPFYFAPRSPMLYAIDGGKVAGCILKQDEIVHVESTVESVVQAKLPYVIYPMNAALAFSTDCFDIIDGLDQINWALFFESPQLAGYCKYFHSDSRSEKYAQRMETRQAEFLVHRSFPLSIVTRIGVANTQRQREVVNILDASGVNLDVEVQRDWYFMGQ